MSALLTFCFVPVPLLLLQTFMDSTGSLWQKGSLFGKAGGVFFSTGTQGGGQESIGMNVVQFFAHHGIVYVPLGYADPKVRPAFLLEFLLHEKKVIWNELTNNFSNRSSVLRKLTVALLTELVAWRDPMVAVSLLTWRRLLPRLKVRHLRGLLPSLLLQRRRLAKCDHQGNVIFALA